MSLNDPQWGKKDDDKRPQQGQDGPPDLDAIWQNLNRRLNDILGGNNGGNGSNRPPSGRPAMSFSPPGGGALWIILIAAALWLSSGFYVVDEGSRGVVTRFGKYIETRQSGLQWHLPFPIERADVVPFSQVRSITIGYRGEVSNRVDRESTMLTDDGNIIDILFAVQYDLSNAEDYIFKNRDPEQIANFVAETAIREVVGKSSVDNAITTGREIIALQTKTLMQQMLDNYGTGINVQQVALQSIQPPDRVQEAFADAVKAAQDRDRMINEGEAYAKNVVPSAKGISARMIEDATGYAAETIRRAEGDADRFTQVLAEYKKAPEVTRNRMYLDTIQSVMEKTGKIVVDQKAGNNLLYLPLDQLLQQSAAASASLGNASRTAADNKNTTPSNANAPTPASDSPARSRDALRNRDR